MSHGNPFHDFDTRSLLAARALLLHDLTDVDENPTTWDYPESSRAQIVYQLSLADGEIGRRNRIRSHPLAPHWPDPRIELDAIKQAIDLDVFIEQITGSRFERRGTRIWTACMLPGHVPDETPSFCVTPAKSLWCCFGCQRGGDHFTFIEIWRDVSFREAVELVALAAGIDRKPRRGVTPFPAGTRTVRVG
jgi:hypothetical protein